jgi:hypothetical protein
MLLMQDTIFAQSTIVYPSTSYTKVPSDLMTVLPIILKSKCGMTRIVDTKTRSKCPTLRDHLTLALLMNSVSAYRHETARRIRSQVRVMAILAGMHLFLFDPSSFCALHSTSLLLDHGFPPAFNRSTLRSVKATFPR